MSYVNGSYAFIHGLLADKKGGEIFTCFGAWHFCYILIALTLVLAVSLYLRNKPQAISQRTCTILIDIAFGLYILDFFLMPFAYEEIDIEKLPFHICTAMCVMCFLSRHSGRFEKYRGHLALLGFISNLVYLIYPAGVMWHAVHPLCYRVIQTLIFHGIMTAYGAITLMFDKDRPDIREWRTDLSILSAMTVWAMVGNALYHGSAGSYDHDFNWFFVTKDPFGIIDPAISPFVMPLVNIVLFFAVELIVYGIMHMAGSRGKKH